MSVQFKDYYASLGVNRSASDADIKKAFRKLAREYHPDVARDKKKAEEKFKEINEAYEVLGDAAKRKRYDDLGPNWKAHPDATHPGNFGGAKRTSGGTGPADFEYQFGGTGFSDFFEQVFGGRRAGNSRGPQSFPGDNSVERGRDIEGDIMVTLDEAMRGSVRSVNVRHAVECETCGGTGRRGQRTCPTCAGQGRVTKEDQYQVKIPAGVTEGQKLRLAGRGEAGARGGEAGDLFLRVRFARHPDFEIEGTNLIHELEISPWEAVLGTSLAVPTLAGTVNIKIPALTQNGQKLRVRGRGLAQHGGTQGDLIVVTRVEMPSKVSDMERKLWEQLSKESSFNPRARK